MAVRHFYDVISYQPDCSKIRRMLSIMCSSFCYFYTSLYLLSLYIYFLTCESHIKESTIKVYYKLYLSCWTRKDNDIQSLALSWLVKNIIELKSYIWNKSKQTNNLFMIWKRNNQQYHRKTTYMYTTVVWWKIQNSYTSNNRK